MQRTVFTRIVDDFTNKLMHLRKDNIKRDNLEKKLFSDIRGHNKIKTICVRAVNSSCPVHVLLVGPSACAKTMFLTDIMTNIKGTLFVVASNTTKAGLINQLFEVRPRYLLIDELEKMKNSDQNSLLHLMETGIISEAKYNKTRQTNLTSSVFATANTCKNIIEPLLSRFLILEIPEYTFEQFREIALFKLNKRRVDEKLADAIAKMVWDNIGSKDIRDVVKVSQLADNIDEASSIISIMKTHHSHDLT